jgi:hypothetical protein
MMPFVILSPSKTRVNAGIWDHRIFRITAYSCGFEKTQA